MPVIKSAIKKARQDLKRTERNREVLANMRSLIRNITIWTKNGETKKAQSMFATTQQAIDMAVKKNLLHKNNAARKKSALAKALRNAGITSVTAVKTKAPKSSAPKAPKTISPKKTASKAVKKGSSSQKK